MLGFYWLVVEMISDRECTVKRTRLQTTEGSISDHKMYSKTEFYPANHSYERTTWRNKMITLTKYEKWI